MSQFDIESDSSSQAEQKRVSKQPTKFIISILKHLPEARKIMQGHNYEHQITKCVYQQPLTNNPNFIIPTNSNTQNLALAHHRLVKIQDVLFQHENMKEKIKSVLAKDGKTLDGVGTLWLSYSGLVPSYARFGFNARKNNFANVMMPINGVNITISNKIADKPIQPVPRLLPLAPDSVRFDSHFESGNLLYAYRKQTLQIETYDLIMQNDINTKGYNQWFYFKIHNTKKHNKIRINIVNFIKNQSMFSYGIKILTFSQRDFNKHKLGWVRDGEKVSYSQNKIKRQCNNKNYYTLSFEYYFKQVDTVYFAPTHPYTYTQLTEYFDNLMAEYSLANFISLKTVTETVGRNSISVITFGTGKRQIKDCSVAWILGRQHPGETTSSYMVEGIINYLVSVYSNPTPEMVQILDTLIFKIVPMVNVDGVVHGNTRAELTGIDPNRLWKRTIKRLSPGVSAIKKLIAQNKQNVKLVLDLHSHSKKVGCFFYGNSLLHDPKSTKIYPTIVCDGDPRFQLKHCRFRGGYETTARSVLFYDMGIKQVYTVECSLLGYLKKNRITQYKIPDYHEMGKKLIESYIKLQKTKIIKAQKQIIEQINDRIIDKEDAESARSQSSLSDEQYEQITQKVKNKGKKRKVKKNQNDNTISIGDNRDNDGLKYFVKKNGKNNGRVQLSLNQKRKVCHQRQMSTNQLRTKYNILNLKNYENKLSKENSFKKQGNFTIKQANVLTKLSQNRKLCDRDISEDKKTANFSRTRIAREISSMKQGRDQKKTIEKKEVQVQVSLNFNDKLYEMRKNSGKAKAENSLCVVGSSLEEDLIYVGKNEVGVQSYQQLIDQAMASDAVKKPVKIRLMPLGAKKFANFNKI